MLFALASQLLDFQGQTFTFPKIFLTLLVLTAVIGVINLLKYVARRATYNKHLPGNKLRFFHVLGNVKDVPLRKRSRNGYPFNVHFLQVVCGYSKLYMKEKLFTFWVAYTPFIVLVKADAIEKVLSGSKMNEKSWNYNWLHPWLGTGLLTSHGSKWKSRRKLLTPSFHFDILKDFLPAFNEQSQVLVKLLEKETEKPFTDIVKPITLCSLDIVCETTLGTTIGAQQNSELPYVKAVHRTSATIMQRMVTPTYWLDWTFYMTNVGKQLKEDLKLLHSFTRSVIHEKKQKLLSGDPESEKPKRKALMDLLLEHHINAKTLTEEDIREEIDTFAFEGHDTTSVGVSWALYLIGLHKDVQDKIHEELDEIFGEDVERTVTTDDLKDMKYLDLVLKESQRLYPSVPIIGRHNNEDREFCGYSIPKGAIYAVLTYALHRDETVFPEPEKFDPDRFLPENSAGRNPYAYIPFSAGPRNCIGQRFALMEEKIIVSQVLRNYTLKSLDSRDKVPAASELILRAAVPLRIQIRPRHLKEKL